MNTYKIPDKYPEYNFVKPQVQKKARFYIALDQFLAVYGFILVFVYTLVLFVSSFQFKLSSVAIFIAFWLMLTYIALPRLHSFFCGNLFT